MKVVIANKIEDVADVNLEDKSAPIITRDGAKLVTMSVSGSNPVAAVLGAFTALLRSIDTVTDKHVVYLFPGSIVATTFESRFNMIVGVAGEPDIDKKITATTNNLLKPVEPVPVSVPAPVPVSVPAPVPVPEVESSTVPIPQVDLPSILPIPKE